MFPLIALIYNYANSYADTQFMQIIHMRIKHASNVRCKLARRKLQ